MIPAELTVGHRFARIHRFDPAQASAFAMAAGDTNPLHHDAQFAASTRFGKCIASGTQTTALLMGLAASYLSARCQVVGVEFHIELVKPVYVDEEVVLEWVIAAIRPQHGERVHLDLAGTLGGGADDVRVRARGTVLAW